MATKFQWQLKFKWHLSSSGNKSSNGNKSINGNKSSNGNKSINSNKNSNGNKIIITTKIPMATNGNKKFKLNKKATNLSLAVLYSYVIWACFHLKYHKVASTIMSWLEAHFMFYRLFIKGKFNVYLQFYMCWCNGFS